MTDADFERLFRRKVEPELFGGVVPAGPGERPALVLLGGQQAAGKSAAEEAIAAAWPGIAYVTGDAFRELQPDYEDLALHNPLAMMEQTNETARWLARRCLDHARGYPLDREPDNGYGPRYSLCTEGVFDNPDMTRLRAERFAAAGFDVHVVVMGVSEHVSRLSAEERYLRAAHTDPRRARWTSPDAHDRAYRTLPVTLAQLESLTRGADAPVRSIEVWARSGPVYRWTHGEPGPDASAHLAAARAEIDTARWLADYQRVRGYAEDHRLTTGPGTEPRPYLDDPRTQTAWRQLDTQARDVIRTTHDQASPAVLGEQSRAPLSPDLQAMLRRLEMTRGSGGPSAPGTTPPPARPLRRPGPRRGPGLGR